MAVVDRDGERAEELAESLKGRAGADTPAAVGLAADVTDEGQLEAAVAAAVEALGELRLAVSCAGIGWAERVVGREGAAGLAPFETVVRVNLIGTFNVLRLTAAAMNANAPDEEGERGAIVMTASIAAYDGQIGQIGLRGLQGRGSP